MKSAVYGYSQSGKDEHGKMTSFRYFGYSRSVNAFIKALLEITEIQEYGNWNWVGERVGETANKEEVRISLKQPDKIFRYQVLTEPNTAIVVLARTQRKIEGVKRYYKREKLTSSIAHEKQLIEFYEHEFQLLDKAEKIGDEGIQKRLDELNGVAKEIDELREILKVLARGRAFEDLSFSELKQRKKKEIESYKAVVERKRVELQKLEKEWRK